MKYKFTNQETLEALKKTHSLECSEDDIDYEDNFGAAIIVGILVGLLIGIIIGTSV